MPAEGGDRIGGVFCVLRMGGKHFVLSRPNPLQFGHLGLETLISIRLAKQFRAPLWILRPSKVVNTAIYELVADDVDIRMVTGRRAQFLTWLFFGGERLITPRKAKPLLYVTPFHHVIVDRFGFTLAPAGNALRKAWDWLVTGRKRVRRYLIKAYRKRFPAPPKPAEVQTVSQPEAAVPAPVEAVVPGQKAAAAAAKARGKGKIVAPAAGVDATVSNLPRADAPLDILPNKARSNPTYVKRHWVDDTPALHLPSEMVPRLQAQAEEKIGIGPDQPVVTLHMRAPGFKAGREVHQTKPHARINDSIRNVTFANYPLAMDHLRSLGYAVVRIGDASMEPIDYPGVIDLATSPHRTDLLELYCVSRSAFFIGCESGPSILAWMTQRPIVTLNASEPLSLSYPVREFDTFTLKHVRDRNDGRLLTPLDLLSRGYLNNSRNPERFDYIENGPEDVLDAIKDMIKISTHGVAPETPEQRQFRLRAIGVGVRMRLENGVVRKHGPHQGYMGRGRLAPSFARRYIGSDVEAVKPVSVTPEPVALTA